MKLISAKCPNCGAQIDVDKNSDKTKCEYCNAKIIVKDAIQKYKLELSGEVEIKNMPKLNNYLKLGAMHYNDGEYEEAYKQYDKALELDPDNYIAVLRKGLSKSLQTNYLKFDVMAAINGMKNSYKILKSKEADKQNINFAVLECNDAIIKLENFAINFYKTNDLNLQDVTEYITRLEICLDGFEYLYGLVCDDIDTKTTIINSIITTIDNILSNKKYIFYSGGNTLKPNYRFKMSYKKAMLQKKQKYILEINSSDSNVYNKNIKKYKKSKVVAQGAKTSEKLCYAMVICSSILFIGSMADGMFMSGLLWLITGVLFVPQLKNIIVKKNEKTFAFVIILRVIMCIISLAVFSNSIPEVYENTWKSDEVILGLNKGKAELDIDNKTVLKGSYTAKSEKSNIYNITVTVSEDGAEKDYQFRYEEVSYNEIRFCLVENDECSIFMTPEIEDSSYTYLTK